MGPFLAVSRHTVVELAAPWDPQAIIRQYFAEPARQIELPAHVVSTLVSEGGVFRLDAKYRSMGSMHADIRLALLSKSQIDLDLRGTLSPSWWLRWGALPFRSRLRKFVDAKLDEVVDELMKEALLPPATEEAIPQSVEPDKPLLESPMRGVQWTLEILTLDGRSLYQHAEGSSSAGRVG
jgi:hypothetical protein